MSTTQSMIYLIYDDIDTQDILNKLQFLDYGTATFSTTEEFLDHPDTLPTNACILTELGSGAVEFQDQMLNRNIGLPILFTSRNASAELAIDVMRRGAVTVIDIPCTLEKLESSIRAALDSMPLARAFANLRDQHLRFNVLSDRERNIACMIAGGKLNKQIASKLGLSIRTIEKYRGQVYQLLKVENTAELTRVVTLAELHQQLSMNAPGLLNAPNRNLEFVA